MSASERITGDCAWTGPAAPGPDFGSYRPDEVSWLLTDLSELHLEADVAERESAIQAGRAHYAESLPIEYQPDPDYQALFDQVLAETAGRLALAVGAVTELVLAERGPDIVLASLARAGTPIGILMRRWAAAGARPGPAALCDLDRAGPGNRPGRAGLPCRPS